MKLISTLTLLSICNIVISQNFNSETLFQYQKASKQAIECMQNNDYLKAYNKLDTALSYNINIELGKTYYNLACCAARLNKDSLAYFYLDNSLNHGFILYEHVLCDNDLITLHNSNKQWSNYIKSLKKHADEMNSNLLMLKKYLTENPNQTKNLIPYKSGEMWGYLESDTKNIVVKPIFDCADFFGTTSALVLFKMNLYKIDKDGIRNLSNIDKRQKIEKFDFVGTNDFNNYKSQPNKKRQLTPYEIRELKKDTLNSVIQNIDEKLIIEDYKGTKVHAIIKNKNEKYNLVDYNGIKLNTLSKDITLIEKSVFTEFPFKAKLKSNKWILLDTLCNSISSTLHSNFKLINRFNDIVAKNKEQNWYNETFSFSKYAILENNGKKMIYDRFSNHLDFYTIDYKNIFFVDSPYNAEYRDFNDTDKDYFLVENYKGEIFFVDLNGVEYKPKSE